MAAIAPVQPAQAERWFPELETNPPIYERQAYEPIGGRGITRYLLVNTDDASINRAVEIMRAFLNAHPNLCPIFPVDQDLRERIRRKPYLSINGEAVCLSKRRHADTRRDYCDKNLTEGLIHRPVRCQADPPHLLDQASALFWVARKGHVCPVLPLHPIGDLQQVDEELAHDIHLHQVEERRRRNGINAIIFTERVKSLLTLIQESLLDRLYEFGPREVLEISEAGAKIGLKTFGKKIAKSAAQATVKSGLQKTVRWVAVKLPLVGTGISIIAAAQRMHEGEYKRAGGEVVSGVLSLLPGWGTVLSITVDCIIAGSDIYAIVPEAENPDRCLHRAYEIMGLHPEPGHAPNKVAVDNGYRAQMLDFHPDVVMGRVPGMTVENANKLAAGINAAKEYIYRQRGWV
jgi:hypothetical protein